MAITLEQLNDRIGIDYLIDICTGLSIEAKEQYEDDDPDLARIYEVREFMKSLKFLAQTLQRKQPTTKTVELEQAFAEFARKIAPSIEDNEAGREVDSHLASALLFVKESVSNPTVNTIDKNYSLGGK